jgi:hypothetical protein
MVVPYADLIDGRADLKSLINTCQPCILKLDSPGKDAYVAARLLALGIDQPETTSYDTATLEQLQSTPDRKGQILWPRQWFAGFYRLLERLDHDIKSSRPRLLIGNPPDIRIMFDKPQCHALLAARGIHVPRALSPDAPVTSHADLLAKMSQARMSRVFVKLSHGSSGSGVVAFQIHAGHQRATTTVEMETSKQQINLFNSRKIVTYTDSAQIQLLIDRLCRHGVHVEQWVPKASISGRVFDLRVLGIAGEPRHVVVRSSNTPITNLHLLNHRDDSEAVRARLGSARWQDLMTTCSRTLALFPHSFCIGIDIAIHSDWRGHSILELNAFGDQLNDTFDRGQDPWEAQIRAAHAALAPQGAQA